MSKTTTQPARPAYMAEYVAKTELKEVLDESNAKLAKNLTESLTASLTESIMTEVADIINKLASHMDERFDTLEHRQDNMAIRLDKVEGSLRQLNSKHDRLLETGGF